MKTGLVLVDIQNDYFPEGHMALVGILEAGQKAAELLSLFRNNSWPTFHIQHISMREGATFFLPDTNGAAIHDCIEPLAGEQVIQKHYPNSFRDTALLEELKNAGIERLVICGAMSHMCIDATVRAAFDLGFKCQVIEDACATRNLEFRGQTIDAMQVHGAFMAALGSAYANVMKLNDFRASL
jgi:nicotinamidase-related amidase